VGGFRDRADAERELAGAAAQRAITARREAAEAAFYDAAAELGRVAEDEERAARVHLEAAREYERMANDDSVAQMVVTNVPDERRSSEGAAHSRHMGFTLWRRRRDDVHDGQEADDGAAAAAKPQPDQPDTPEEDERVRFFEFSRDMLATAGFDGYFKLVNHAWERTLGYSKEELCSQPYMAFVHPADTERTTAEAESLGTAGVDTVQFRNRYRAKDGSYKWLEWSARADMARQIIYAVARDVTEHQRAAEVEGRLSAIVRSSNDAIYGVSPQGKITSWNAGAERLYGYTASEIVGEPLGKLIPKTRAGEDRELLVRVLAGETVEHVETERLRKDGTPVEASISMSQIRDVHGQIVGASASARDIGQTRRAEREREQANQHFRAAFDEAPIGMALIDPDGNWLEVNLAFLEATGHNRSALAASNFETVLDAPSREVYRDRMKDTYSSGLRTFRVDAHLLGPDSTTSPMVITVSVTRDYLGQPVHFVCHFLPADS
jgi:PAS domain S-box-containing protein